MVSKNILNGLGCFLSGPIDNAEDDGIIWRNTLKKLCNESELGVVFLDPCSKKCGGISEIGEEKEKINRLKNQGRKKWKECQKEIKKFKRLDYRMVDKCDFYVIYIDNSIHMSGSYFECKVAEEERKPIYIILAPHMKKGDIPSWMVDLVDYDDIFYDVFGFVEHLKKIDCGEIEINDKWITLE